MKSLYELGILASYTCQDALLVMMLVEAARQRLGSGLLHLVHAVSQARGFWQSNG